jgi:hypothetical protein
VKNQNSITGPRDKQLTRALHNSNCKILFSVFTFNITILHIGCRVRTIPVSSIEYRSILTISSGIEYRLILRYRGALPRDRPTTHQTVSQLTFRAATAPITAISSLVELPEPGCRSATYIQTVRFSRVIASIQP